MLIDSQISTYIIPQKIWYESSEQNNSLPPIFLPARDALAIERRAEKEVNLKNETRRYTLCCERIQGIVLELSQMPGDLAKNIFVWPAMTGANTKIPPARAYLSNIAMFGRWAKPIYKVLSSEHQANFYDRIATNFFPPEDCERYLKGINWILNHPESSELFKKAAAHMPETFSKLSANQCRQAFLARRELVKIAVDRKCGLVDVVEVV